MPEREIDIKLVQKHDILKVVPGQNIPTDGVVMFGRTSIDESMLTGESFPVSKKIGDSVIGGTSNKQVSVLSPPLHIVLIYFLEKGSDTYQSNTSWWRNSVSENCATRARRTNIQSPYSGIFIISARNRERIPIISE